MQVFTIAFVVGAGGGRERDGIDAKCDIVGEAMFIDGFARGVLVVGGDGGNVCASVFDCGEGLFKIS